MNYEPTAADIAALLIARNGLYPSTVEGIVQDVLDARDDLILYGKGIIAEAQRARAEREAAQNALLGGL